MFGKILALGLSAATVTGLATPCWSQEKPVAIAKELQSPNQRGR